MKRLIFAGLALASVSLNAAPGFALVQQVVRCATGDGRYQLSIDDNQGISPGRVSHFEAEVATSEGAIVARYRVTKLTSGMKPVTSAAMTYGDKDTAGGRFLFATASTTAGPKVRVELSDGTVLGYGAPGEEALTCN